ncbi:hypothetical protein ABW21_db0202271 [Orbilia brochopaga]|nr:hypothetical protein ABW21_db0202271 [Drechslerella brochopaga]
MESGEDIVGINGHESPPIFNGVDASQLDADLETCKLVDIDGTCIGWFTKDVKIKKRVFKGTFIRASNGEKLTSIMKVFPPEDDPSFDDGRTTLFDTELWASTQMNGSQYTPPLIASGRSRGGYTTPGGDVVIKGICPGIRVQDDIWDSLTPATEGHPILDALKAAIQAFRDQNLVLWDITREDVLWDEPTQKLTIVDLESADSLTRVSGATDRFEIRGLIPAFWE